MPPTHQPTLSPAQAGTGASQVLTTRPAGRTAPAGHRISRAVHHLPGTLLTGEAVRRTISGDFDTSGDCGGVPAGVVA
jgi:hypothetical protein